MGPRANLPRIASRERARTSGEPRTLSDGLVPASAGLAMSFGIYLFGIVLMIAGLVYGAAIVHAPVQWIVVGALVLLGVGVVAAVKSTRQRAPAE